ncbi:MAG: putative bifunctional diguanylate cyclase/phosphodiesterase [Spirulina sp.]
MGLILGWGQGAGLGQDGPREDVLRVGIYDNPPKVFWDAETGQPRGFFPEILDAIAEEEAWDITYVPCQWADCLADLEAGRLDLMMDVAYSQEREARFDFNRVVVVPSWSVVVARRGVKLDSVLDLDGKRLGVLKDSIQANALASTSQGFDIRPDLVLANTIDDLARLLEAGEVDGVLVHRFFPFQERLPQGVQTNILIQPTQLHFVSPKGRHQEILAALDRQLTLLKNNPDSVYYELSQHWLLGLEVYKTNWPLLRRIMAGIALGVAAVGTGLLVIWNRSLRREMDQRLAVQAQLNHELLHDSLTGLPNRKYMMAHLEDCLGQVSRSELAGFIVLFLDLDRFKVVNDSLGHLLGDQLLLEMAERLRQTTYWVARLGGDEFVMVLEHTDDVQRAIPIAEQILTILGVPCHLEGHDITVGASIGMVRASRVYQAPMELIRDADIAMYSAKAKGRNRYAIFEPDMHLAAAQQLTLETDLRHALAQQQFVLYYQPIVDLRSGRMMGLEALVRWQHPTLGLLPPGRFIPLAEDTGLIVPLGWWVLDTACAQLAQWRRQQPYLGHLTVSVNVSASQLREPHWLDRVNQALHHTGLEGSSLILEITETLLLQNMNLTASLMQQLQHGAVGISIDDFGTGYSSFSYLHQLPITSFKIDRLFITDLTTQQKNQDIVKTMLVLARQMGVSVTAEGIETQAQMDLLRLMGCNLGQGYGFDPPLPADQMFQRLQAPVYALASVNP